MDENHKFEEMELGIFQLVMLILSVYVIIVFAIETTIPISPDLQKVFDYTDFCCLYLFSGGFMIRFFSAPSKLGYLRWGWIDLLSSIPILPFF